MNMKDLKEALIWLLVASFLVAAWCGVTLVRNARADTQIDLVEHAEAPSPALPQVKSKEHYPVWVIVVFETQGKRILGVTEFVFATFDACRTAAEQTKRKFELNLMPVCYLRWLKELPGTPA